MRTLLVVATALAATLALAPTAGASSLFTGRVSADEAQKRRCDARLLDRGTDGVARRTVRLEGPSLMRASLRAARGDWDLGLFQKSTGRSLAGSAGLRSNELAEAFVPDGEIVVQACRRKGSARKARMKVSAVTIPVRKAGEEREISKLVRVPTPHLTDAKRLQSLGLDLTEHGGDGHLEVVLHGQADEQKLRAAGFSFEVEIADLAARHAQNRLADARYARRVRASSLPSERTTYRRLVDFEFDIKRLAESHPDLVKPFVLPYTTMQGRPVHGLEITQNVNANDGKPVFLEMGVHHAREWPSGEAAMEFAIDLVSNYGSDPRITDLLQNVRAIVVPIVNPDGYNLSREAPIDARALGTTAPVTRAVMDALRPAGVYGDLNSLGMYSVGLENAGGIVHQYASNPGGVAAILIDQNTSNFAYKRRNCRIPAGRNQDCAHSSNRMYGTDPNRNYGGFWGGAGASNSPSVDTFRGPGPFSEPETMNIRQLVTSRQVTALITNHTYSNLVLRPPGVAAEGPAPDETEYKKLGDAMARATGFTSQYSFQLYDTSGTTEDWSYFQTGGYGFTFEIGPHEFHPPYEQVVAEYEGNQPTPVDGVTAAPKDGGLREAYLIAMEHAADTSNHAVLTGKGPKGARLEARRTGSFLTSPVVGGNGPLELSDTATSSMTIPQSGRFEWHLNPSTRPYAKRDRFAMSSEAVSSQAISGGPVPPTTSIPVEIEEGEPRYFVAKIAGTGTGPREDYDLYLYRGDVADPRKYHASSATESHQEQIVLESLPPGRYTLEVRNFSSTGGWAGTIERRNGDPSLGTAAATEAWSVTCTKPDGTVSGPHNVVVDRGQRLDGTTLCRSGKSK